MNEQVHISYKEVNYDSQRLTLVSQKDEATDLSNVNVTSTTDSGELAN